MIAVKPIEGNLDLEKAFEIRRRVFVIEQAVDPTEEYDEHEVQCTHFLALFNNVPAGTARIRHTDHGIKLERFAVLQEYRGKDVGKSLVLACLAHPDLRVPGTYVYMHAQEHALDFYARFGFETEGERFWECNIPHFTMSKTI
ncbi:MAG: GNAT family N-acetyltransferase [Bacteroidetes bacterium]|nr:GNAT family N-acetyltransferase [Bacteroidota bacterium]